jgi:protein arginine kinase activator
MVCDKCKMREANVQVVQTVNGVQQQQHLCMECAQELGGIFGGRMGGMSGAADLFRNLFGDMGMSMMPGNMLSGMVPAQQAPETVGDTKRFEALGLTLPDLDAAPQQAQASKDLQAQLEEALQNEEYEKAAQLRDRMRKQREEATKPEDAVGQLKAQLKEALDKEDYESAARLRDQIKAAEENA